MSKLVLVLACAVVIAVAVGAAAFLLRFFPNILASVPNSRQIIEYIQRIPEHIQNGVAYILQLAQQVNAVVPTWLFGVAGSIVSAVSLKAWSNVKTREQEAVQALNTTQIEANATITDLQGQLEAKDKLLTGVTDLQAKYDTLLTEKNVLTTRLNEVQARYQESSSQIGKVISPPPEEMKRRLETEYGYRVVKIVA